jgi:hypothetical protein
MKKEEYQELMHLSVYGELSEDDQKKLDGYIKRHPEMKKELQELKKFRAFMLKNTSSKTSDGLLNDARRQLRGELRKERSKSSILVYIGNFFGEFLHPKFALSGAGILSVGMLIGYCSFSPTGKEGEIVIRPVSSSPETGPGTSITNVRFIDSDASDGEVEFEFDAVAPMHVKGRIDDPEVQKLLTHALLNESNAGVRLSTVNALRDHTVNNKMTDQSIKAVLIMSLRSDMNPGVRREALRVLQQYDFDNDIRDALLMVISKDGNSGIRVAAINALEIAKMDGIKFDDATINALKNQIGKEKNNYVRNRTVNLVKEIYQ